MPKITPEIIKKLDNKVKCSCCHSIIFEGVIERGAINIQCHSCGTDNTIFVTGEQKERFIRNQRSMVVIIQKTVG